MTASNVEKSQNGFSFFPDAAGGQLSLRLIDDWPSLYESSFPVRPEKCLMSGALARKLEALRERGAMVGADVAVALGANPLTVLEWEEGRLFPGVDKERTLVELEYIVDLLSDFYGPYDLHRWLFTPQTLLTGAVPVDLIRQGRIDEVLRLVRQLREGSYI